MSTQNTQPVPVKIEWDDGAVMVFSFGGNGGTTYCGFLHVIPAAQVQWGTQTAISQSVQTLQQTAIQATGDPQTWVETVKNAARGGKATIVYDDSINVNYTTQTTQSFQLQLLYSICG